MSAFKRSDMTARAAVVTLLTCAATDARAHSSR